MNSIELIATVKAKVKDESFSDAEILALLNEALLKTAHDLCLPGLQKNDTLTFAVGDDLFAALPDDYDHEGSQHPTAFTNSHPGRGLL